MLAAHLAGPGERCSALGGTADRGLGHDRGDPPPPGVVLRRADDPPQHRLPRARWEPVPVTPRRRRRPARRRAPEVRRGPRPRRRSSTSRSAGPPHRPPTGVGHEPGRLHGLRPLPVQPRPRALRPAPRHQLQRAIVVEHVPVASIQPKQIASSTASGYGQTGRPVGARHEHSHTPRSSRGSPPATPATARGSRRGRSGGRTSMSVGGPTRRVRRSSAGHGRRRRHEGSRLVPPR